MSIIVKSDNPWDTEDLPTEKKPRASQEEKKNTASSKKNDPVFDFMEKLQESIKDRQKKGGGVRPPEFDVFLNMKWLFIGAAVLFLLYLGSGFYRVEEGELALVLRFGKLARIENPGLRYHIPSPIEKVIVQNVAVVNKIDSNQNHGDTDQTLILTGDENMVHSNYTVLWKIQDIRDYVFTSRDPATTIRAAAESAVREMIGRSKARQALTEGREKIAQDAQNLLQKILDSYKLGVSIVSLQLQRVDPPSQVVEAFLDMQASRVDADRLSNEAEGYRNDIIPRARGEAVKIVQDAEAYEASRVMEADGEASRFEAVVKAYKRSPDAVKRRIYDQTVQDVLGKVKNKTIVDGKLASKSLPLLDLKDKVGGPK